MSGLRNFISIPHIEVAPSDLTLEDDPTQWDWEDLLEIEKPENIEILGFEELS